LVEGAGAERTVRVDHERHSYLHLASGRLAQPEQVDLAEHVVVLSAPRLAL
jgi:hypothetical protein